MIFLFVFLGIFIGFSIAEFEGAIFGGLLGLMSGFIYNLKQKLLEQSNKLQQLRNDFNKLSQHYQNNQFLHPKEDSAIQEVQKTQQEEIANHGIIIEEPEKTASHIAAEITDSLPKSIIPDSAPIPAPVFDNELNKESQVPIKISAKSTSSSSKAKVSRPVEPEPQPNPFEPLLNSIKNFFTKGNPIVKVASVVLFFGVAFLLKYAAERNFFPIEWRLVGVAIAAIALLIWALRLPEKYRQYSLIVQGAAIGILYITVYAAANFYSLLPLSLAFVLLFILAVLGAFLAVRQDSPNLAIFSIVGGFLAPILTSSGSNAYVQLFSYYSVLNLGILFISWFKSWRHLNWIGFFFTFLIGSLWGAKAYRAEFFSNTEPFLIFHFLLYLIIPILFLKRQSESKTQTSQIIQTGIVFGLPTISFVLQLSLVKDFINGESISAIAWSLAYFLAWGFIYKQNSQASQAKTNLAQSYLAIAITFFTLFIFYQFDADVTSVFWALEAVALIWMGLRQQQLLVRALGLVIFVASGLLYMQHFSQDTLRTLFINSSYLPGAILSIAAFTIGKLYHQASDSKQLRSFIDIQLAIPFAVLGLFIAIVSGLIELPDFVSANNLIAADLIYLTGFSLLLYFVGKLIRWPLISNLSLILYPALAIALFLDFAQNPTTPPLQGLAFFTYPFAFISCFFISKVTLKQTEQENYLKPIASITGNLMAVFLVSWQFAAMAHPMSENGHWYLILFGLVPALIFFINIKFFRPFFAVDTKDQDLSRLRIILATYLGLWFLLTFFTNIHPDNLEFLPIVNPLTLTEILIAHSLYTFYNQQSRFNLSLVNQQKIYYALGVVAFLWLNLVVARYFNHQLGIAFNPAALFELPVFQATITSLWSLVAIVVMFFSKQRASRNLWFVGISILGAILLKLVLFDMADSGTLARIISFLVVGAIMLAIGYFAPLPPKRESNAQSTNIDSEKQG